MPRRPGEKIQRQKEKEHAKEYNAARPKEHRFYGRAVWRKLRDSFMRKNPLCAECLRHGVVKEANIVDHIIPIAEGGAEMDENNLQSLCFACHNRKHGG